MTIEIVVYVVAARVRNWGGGGASGRFSYP
jgi:hypothetical protein